MAVSEYTGKLTSKSHYHSSSKSGKFNQSLRFKFLLDPVHTISENQSALCVCVANLYSQSFSIGYDIHRSIGVVTYEIFHKTHWACQIDWQLLQYYGSESSENTYSSMFVQKHVFNAGGYVF